MKPETAIKKIEKLEKERTELFAKRKPIDTRLVSIAEELEPLQEIVGKAKAAQMEGKVDIEFLLTPEFKSQALYREADRQMHSLGMYRTGYFHAINQACIKLMLRPANLQQTYESVQLFLPHMKVFPAVAPDGSDIPEHFQGRKVFGIFEHTLSANGTYFFTVLSDSSTEILRGRGMRSTVIGKFPDLMSGLKYVQKYHYYGDEEND